MGTDSPEEKRPTTPVEFDKLHESLRESSARLSRSLVIFVLALLYLLITVASTTDLQLLLPDSRVKLPVLNVEQPLFGFYSLAPLLVLILHFSFLLHLLHHVRKLKAWISATTKEQRVLLPSFIFNYTYTYSIRPKTINYWLIRALQVAVLGFSPLLLLLYMQVRFADYHSVPMTAWHFVVVGLDVFILIVYWYRIINPEYLGERSVLRKILGLVPGKGEKMRPWIGTFLLGLWRFVNPSKENRAGQMYTWLFALALLVSASCLSIVWMITTDRYWHNDWFLPRLVVRGESLVKSPPSDVIIHAYLTRGLTADSAWIDHAKGIDLRGRDLRFADLSRCNLLNGLLQNVRLNGADLRYSELNGADLGRAKLNGAKLFDAELNGARLRSAELNGADFSYTELNGADLGWAWLNGANLENAKLNGACLRFAKLNGATLRGAELNGAELREVELNGAILRSTKLNGANLSWARLIGGSLTGTQLNGTDLTSSKLSGASFVNVPMNGAYVERAALGGCRGLHEATMDGVYFMSGFDTVTLPLWDLLIADSIKIPAGARRSEYLSHLDTAAAYPNMLDPTLDSLYPDLVSFVGARMRLVCVSTWIAYGLLRQVCYDFFPEPNTRDSLLVHMCAHCPDSLEIVRAREQDRLMRYPGDTALLHRIDSISHSYRGY